MQAITRYTLRIWFGLVVLCLAAAVTLLHSAVLSPLLRPIGEEFGNPDATTGQLATLGSLVGFAFALCACGGSGQEICGDAGWSERHV